MKKVKVNYVKFYAPGSFLAESWTKEVDSLEPSKIEWPENAYALTLHERTDVVDGGEVFQGKPQQVGLMHYHPDSLVETLEEVKRNPNATSILVSNMECNNWNQVVWTRWGNWPQPFDSEKHCVLIAVPEGVDQ